jgi:hypothetical protein
MIQLVLGLIRLVLDLIPILQRQRMTQYCASNKVDNGREQKVKKKKMVARSH